MQILVELSDEFGLLLGLTLGYFFVALSVTIVLVHLVGWFERGRQPELWENLILFLVLGVAAAIVKLALYFCGSLFPATLLWSAVFGILAVLFFIFCVTIGKPPGKSALLSVFQSVTVCALLLLWQQALQPVAREQEERFTAKWKAFTAMSKVGKKKVPGIASDPNLAIARRREELTVAYHTLLEKKKTLEESGQKSTPEYLGLLEKYNAAANSLKTDEAASGG